MQYGGYSIYFPSKENITPLLDDYLTNEVLPCANNNSFSYYVFSEMIERVNKKAKKISISENARKRIIKGFFMGLSFFAGGRCFYLPKMKLLTNKVRDMEIAKKFNGSNCRELSKQFNLTDIAIYIALRKEGVRLTI